MISLKVYLLSNLKVTVYCFFKDLFNLIVIEKNTILNLTPITYPFIIVTFRLTPITYRLFIITYPLITVTYRLFIITYQLFIVTYRLIIKQDSLHSD